MELGHARLGDVQHLADFPEGEVLVVVQGDHEPLALGQRFDRVGEPVLELGRLGSLSGSTAPGSWIVSRIEIWLPSGSVKVHRSSSASTDEFAISSSAPRKSSASSRASRHLLVGRRPLELGLERDVGALDVAGPSADRARHPVQRAQLVDDRPLYAGDRIGLELDVAIRIEALDRADQPQQPVRDQVRLVHVRRQARRPPPGDELDQRRVGDDESLAGLLITFVLKQAPELAQLGRLDVPLHPRPGSECSCGPPSSRRSTPSGGTLRIHGAAGRARHGCRSGSWDARMAEQLLDRAQIRAALEQVSREGMAQGVRGDPARHRGLPDPLEQRRRTSEGESRLPRRETNSARSSGAGPSV